MNIKLSVALPMYKSEKIGWLALESLCRQEKVDFNWELLIAEEVEESLGEEEIFKYKDRLAKVGCVRIRYQPLIEHVKLPVKWYLLSQQVSKTSIGFLLQACDCYSQKFRLKETFDEFYKNNADWVQYKTGYFYSISEDKWALYRNDDNLFYHPCALDMAISTRLLDRLYPEERIAHSVDSWIYQQTKPLNIINLETVSSLYGMNTDGMNRISKNRIYNIIKELPPYSSPGVYDGFNIPPEIMKRVKDLRPETEKIILCDYDLLPDITMGIVITREEMFPRAYNSVMDHIYPGQIKVITINNVDRKKSIGKCYNELVAQCDTPLLGFIGDDDWIMPDYFITLIAVRKLGIDSGRKPVCSTCYLTLANKKRVMPYMALAPGIWNKEYLLKHPFNEDLHNRVTATYYTEMNKRGDFAENAEWYYGYIYYQHGDNISGNKFDQFKKAEEKKIDQSKKAEEKVLNSLKRLRRKVNEISRKTNAEKSSKSYLDQG